MFLSPPFADLTGRPDELLQALRTLQDRVADQSVITLQSERDTPLEEHPAFAEWEHRHYSRNVLLLWQKADEAERDAADASGYDEAVSE